MLHENNDTDGNLGLLYSHALDLIRGMHLSLRLFRANATKSNGKVVFSVAHLMVIWKSNPKKLEYGLCP